MRAASSVYGLWRGSRVDETFKDRSCSACGVVIVVSWYEDLVDKLQ